MHDPKLIIDTDLVRRLKAGKRFANISTSRARGRGWTLWKALITVAGHDANQAEAERSRRVIDEVLADHANFTR